MYDIDYYYLTLRLNSSTAELISRIRWDFIAGLGIETVLDYGAGVGWFKAYAPKGVDVDTYDVGVAPTTGMRRESYDMVTMWDVIEHVPDIDSLKRIFGVTKYLALSVPILPPNKSLHGWKHWKPGEHLHYFDVRMLDEILSCYGFRRIKIGEPEAVIREDIVSLIYEKSNP